MVDGELMVQRMIICAAITISVLGCTSLPPDLACRAGIKRLDHAAQDKQVYTARERARFESILRTAKRWEDSRDYERCVMLVERTKPRDFYCELDAERRVKCENKTSLRVPERRRG